MPILYIYDTYGHERDVVREFWQRPVNNFEQAPFPVTQFPKIFVFSCGWSSCRRSARSGYSRAIETILVIQHSVQRRAGRQLSLGCSSICTLPSSVSNGRRRDPQATLNGERWLAVANWHIGSGGRAGFPEWARPHASGMPTCRTCNCRRSQPLVKGVTRLLRKHPSLMQCQVPSLTSMSRCVLLVSLCFFHTVSELRVASK